MYDNQSLMDYIDELEELLLWVYDRLSEMTTREFANGGDKDIRDKIAELLDIQEEA